jgi:hypothetical protein
MASTASLEPTLEEAVASYEMALKGSTDMLIALQELSSDMERAKKMICLLIGRDVSRHTSTVWNDLVVARLIFDVQNDRALAILTSGQTILSAADEQDSISRKLLDQRLLQSINVVLSDLPTTIRKTYKARLANETARKRRKMRTNGGP